jgi:hypothetical protein
MKKEKKQPTYVTSICDAMRKQFFTTYNVDLMNRIRDIKLQQQWCTAKQK